MYQVILNKLATAGTASQVTFTADTKELAEKAVNEAYNHGFTGFYVQVGEDFDDLTLLTEETK